MWLKALKHRRLSISLHFGHNGLVQIISTAWTSTAPQALMQFPNRITQPCQLKRTQLLGASAPLLGSNPVAQAASLVNALSRSGTRWRNSSSRTNFTV